MPMVCALCNLRLRIDGMKVCEVCREKQDRGRLRGIRVRRMQALRRRMAR